MSYTPTIWQNSPSTATPISADNLNHIEQGIADLDDQLNGANGIVQELQTAELNIQSLDENKVSKEVGYGLSQNDFTDTLKDKLDGIADNAEVNVQSDYAQEDTTADDYIKNKPMAVEKNATSSFKTINGGLLTKCIVDLTPKQDLHGYDYPWVGGAGKNKLPLVLADIKSNNTGGTWSGNVYSKSNGTFEILVDSDNNVTGIKINGTFNAETVFYLATNNIPNVMPAGDYILNGCPSGGGNSTYRLRIGGTGSDIGNGMAFTLTEAGNANPEIVIANGYNAQNLIFYPMIRLSTETDATFASYSNECSISGHTEVDVQRDGKNQLPMVMDTIKTINTQGTWSGNMYTKNNAVFDFKTDSNGYITHIDVSGTPNSNDIQVLLCRHEKLSANTYIGNGASDTYRLRVSDEQSGSDVLINHIGSSPTTFTFDGTEDIRIAIRIQNMSGQALSFTYYPMLRLSTETDSSFVPYKSILKVINLGGTYYGGYIDFVSGEFVVTHGFDTFDGSVDEGWSLSGNSKRVVIGAIASAVKRPLSNSVPANIISNQFKSISSNSTYQGTYGISVDADNGSLGVCDGTGTMIVADWRTFLSNNPLQVCYELATPTTISLTPQQIESLAGVNYIDAPLDGQSIETDGIGYKELFGWDDVVNYVQSVVNA